MIRRTAITQSLICGLVDRIEAALARIDPGLADRLRACSPDQARALVAEVTGAELPNGFTVETLHAMALAAEEAADKKLSTGRESRTWDKPLRESTSSPITSRTDKAHAS